jgi:hypothetical protein
MFPIYKDRLPFLEIAKYWSREIQPPASSKELLAHLEEAWWLGEIAGDAALSRLQLLKKMFESRRHYQHIVFVTEDDPGPPTIVKQPDGTVQVDVSPQILVPRDSEEWNEVSCAAAFEMLAKSPSFKYYPEISPGLDFIELTRDEFVKWLLVRGYEIPRFWGRRGDTTPLRQPPLI